jgi:Flp pilus assembly protein TadB
MITDSNLDRAADHHTRHPRARRGARLDDLGPGSIDTPRARRRTRKNILWVSLVIFVLGAAFLVVSLLIGATLAPPVVVMVAGVLGALLSGVLRRASASDRTQGHTTE